MYLIGRRSTVFLGKLIDLFACKNVEVYWQLSSHTGVSEEVLVEADGEVK